MRILGREPAQWLALVTGAVALFSALIFPLGIEQQGALNAVAAAVIGVITALAVSTEKAAPLAAGFIQALLALAISFGANIGPDTQGVIMAFVAAVVGFFLRTQVVAPVPAGPLTERPPASQ